jgi:DNA-binding IclR family transcriptional regulator
MEKRNTEVQSLSRAIAILRVFSHEVTELGVTEIARRVDLHKSTTFRLLGTLSAEGLVAQDRETGRYRLGIGLLELSSNVQLHIYVRQASRPYLQPLAQKLGGTVNLAVLDAGMSFNLEQAIPRGFLVNSYGWVGRRTPLHATSTGKVLLAWLAPADVQANIAEPLESFTPNTITSADVFLDELEAVQRAGYSIDHEEYEVGLNAVAAPLRDRTGAVVAALSVSGPSYRLSPDDFEMVSLTVLEAASSISHELGYKLADEAPTG